MALDDGGGAGARHPVRFGGSGDREAAEDGEQMPRFRGRIEVREDLGDESAQVVLGL